MIGGYMIEVGVLNQQVEKVADDKGESGTFITPFKVDYEQITNSIMNKKAECQAYY